MKKTFLAIALAVSATSAWSQTLQEAPPEFQGALKSVVDKLKDPDSARFRKLRLAKDPQILCGEVNSKNSYGGYSGFAPFSVNIDFVEDVKIATDWYDIRPIRAACGQE